MQQNRIGVAFRLGAGVAAITACTVVAGIAALVLLGQFREGFSAIASAKLPAVAIINQLNLQTERTVTEAANFASGDQESRAQGLQGIARQRLVLQAMADQLQEDQGNLPVLDGYNEHLTTLIDNARRLSKAIDAKTRVDAQMAGNRRRLMDLQHESDNAGKLSEGERLFALLSEQAQHSLALAFSIESRAELDEVRQGFNAVLAQAKAAAPAGKVAVVAELDAIGTGPDNVFDGRARQLELFRSEMDLLTTSREMSSQFSTSVADAIQGDSVALTSLVERGMTFLKVLVGVCVAVAFGIFVYISRAVIRRLVRLKDCMYAHVEGRDAPIPVDGKDEISTMGQALQFFVDTIEGREKALRTAKDLAEAKSEQVASLLDNSGEGFLSFGRDMVVSAEHSRACEAMLGRAPAGCDAASLLFPGNDNAASLFRTIVPQALGDCDNWKREVLLTLLPSDLKCGEKLLQARYTVLDDGELMVVLRDVTEERKLERKIENEHRQLEMIVAAVTERGDFFDTVDAFRTFTTTELRAVLSASVTPRLMVKEVYRQVHTFKGLFNQFSFQKTPDALHQLETRLSTLLGRGDMLTVKDVAEAVAAFSFEALIEADLAVIRNALGVSFLENSGHIALSPAQAKKLERLAGCMMRGEPVDNWEPDIRELLSEISRLSKVPVRDVLEGFNRLVKQTASRLEKEVAPVAVHGGDNLWIDPEAYRPFLRSLVHVFRNAVVHGIEDPDTRLRNGKDETGNIRCSVSVDGDWLRMEIADDGAGLDVGRLRQTAVDAGVLDAAAAIKLPDEEVIDLIFADQVTTGSSVNELAGRGIGLAAVRDAARTLGGDAKVDTAPGKGTRFSFTLPLRDGAIALAS